MDFSVFAPEQVTAHLSNPVVFSVVSGAGFALSEYLSMNRNTRANGVIQLAVLLIDKALKKARK